MVFEAGEITVSNEAKSWGFDDLITRRQNVTDREPRTAAAGPEKDGGPSRTRTRPDIKKEK